MQNLINEEDFVKPVKYNPWKRFVLFYGIAFLNMEVFYLIVQSTNFDSSKSIILLQVTSFFSAILFLIMPFVMIFHTRKNIHLKQSTLYKGIGFLMLTYFLTHHILEIINNSNYFRDFGDNIGYTLKNLGMYTFYGLISSLIITPIIKKKLKRLSNTQKHN